MEARQSTCVVSVVRGSGAGHPSVLRAMQNKAALCAACGFRCLLDTNGTFGSHDRHPSWDKVLALQAAMRRSECNLTLWADADTVFYRPFTLPATLFAQAPMAAGRDYGGLNSGLMWFARSPLSDAVLAAAWREKWFNGEHGAGSRDQAAFHHVLRHRRSQLTILENIVRYAAGTRYRTAAQRRNGSLTRLAPVYHHAGCRCHLTANRLHS